MIYISNNDSNVSLHHSFEIVIFFLFQQLCKKYFYHVNTLYSFYVNIFRDLSGNQLSIIGNTMFGGTSYVSNNFFLNGNGMYGISFDAFENCGMKNIYLGNNAFTLFPQVIQTKLFEIM
jgi:hypothetical protein